MKNRTMGRCLAVACFMLIFVFFYALLPSKAFRDDDLFYVIAVEKGDITHFSISHPHHFLWSYLALAFYKACSALGYEGSAVPVLSLLDAALAFFGLCCFYLLQRRTLSLSAPAALLSSLFLGFSFGYWNNAVTVGAYCLETVILIPVFFLILGMNRKGAAAGALWCGLLIGAAAATQKVDLLIVPIICIYFFVTGGMSRERARTIAVCALFSLIFIGVSTCIVGFFIMGLHSTASFIQWFMAYGEKYVYFHPSNLIMMVAASVRALWGIDFLKAYLVGRGGAVSILLACFLVAASCVLCGMAAYLVKRRRVLDPACREAFALAVVWAAVFSFFFSFYDPGNFKFLVRNIVPAAVLFGIAYDSAAAARPALRGFFVAVVACVFAVNFFGTVLPQSSLEKNDDSVYARFVIESTEPEGLLVFFGTGESLSFLQVAYFGGREVIEVGASLRDPEAFDRRLRSALESGRACYFIEEEKKVGSYHLYGPLQEKVKGFSRESEAAGDFLKKHGYLLKEHRRYEAPTNYRGNRIYLLELEDEHILAAPLSPPTRDGSPRNHRGPHFD